MNQSQRIFDIYFLAQANAILCSQALRVNTHKDLTFS
jgi:hypothetical protein